MESLFASLRSSAPFWSLRYVEETRETLAVRQDTIEPPRLSIDRGVMLTAITDGGYGYCATSDLSPAGLQAALDRATRVGRSDAREQRVSRFDPQRHARAAGRARAQPAAAPSLSRSELYDLLADECRARAHRRAHRRALRGARAAARSSSSISRTPAATCGSDSATPMPYAHVAANHGHRDADAQLRARAAGRPRAHRARSGFVGCGAAPRGRGAAAPRRAELPVGRDGPPAHARPDDAADPRVDRPSARARPHPRRRAQLRRHELRHARDVRRATATARRSSTSPSTRRAPEQLASFAFDDDGDARAKKRGSSATACSSGRSAAALSQLRARLPGTANSRACELEPPADRPHGESQRRAGRELARRR